MHQWLHWNDFLYSKSVTNVFLLTCKIVNQPTSVPDDAAWILHRNIERIKMYKLLRLNSHESLAVKINAFQTNHTHETRGVTNQNLRFQRANLTKFQYSFLYRGINFWNSTPLDLRNIPDDVNTFKRLLKVFLLS